MLRTIRGCVAPSILLLAVSGAPTLAAVPSGQADTTTIGASADSTTLDEVVVTAQKRSENLRDVPLSINAASGDQLRELGINGPADLAKIVPGFTYAPSTYGTPVYTIRGIGFYDIALAVPPTVSVYVDQIPLAYSAMTVGSAFDLERVEVLKGPQGTLFGQNSTGGAINYIAAKPTKTFDSGADVTGGNFGTADLDGFISGPLSDTVAARVAVRTEQMGDWQKSETRDATLGRHNLTMGRALLDWTPSDALSFELNVNGWQDKSDTQAAQFVRFSPVKATGYQDLVPVLSAYASTPNNNRLADWDPGISLARDNKFENVALHANWAITDAVSLTSITSWAHYSQHMPTDSDGTDVDDFQITLLGSIQSWSQELRLAGRLDDDKLEWMLGGNFEDNRVNDDEFGHDSATNSGFGPARFHTFDIRNDQKTTSTAGFGSLDYKIVPTVTLQGSVRFTQTNDRFSGCLYDTGNGELAGSFSLLALSPIAPGACVTLNPTTLASVPTVDKSLDQNNVSWRGGVSWKPTADDLYYFNVTKGYKAGSFPTVPGLTPDQYNAVPQESVTAYEVGVRNDVLDRSMEISAAAFYYDYRNKQLEGYITTAFGKLPSLISVPKASVKGAEFNARWRPLSVVTLSLGGSYLDTRVKSNYITEDPFANPIDIQGESFPYAPKWQATGDAEYRFPLRNSLHAYLGVGGRYSSETQAVFGNSPDFAIPSYTIVDARAGVERDDGHWRAELWGHNITDRFYLLTVTHVADTVARMTGFPATYGVTVSYRY